MLKEGKFQTKCLPNGTWSHPIPKCWSEYCSCFTKQTTALLLALLVGHRTCDLQVRVLAGHLCVMALGKLITPVCLCHQAVQLGTDKEVG